jgi:hypothetical protein
MPNPIDETLAHPGATTLDECLRRAPTLITDADLDAIIAASRSERAQFQIKAEQREARRDGVEETDEAGVVADQG